MTNDADRHHRRQWSVRDGRIDGPRGANGHDAVRRSVGALCHRYAARSARGVPGPAWGGPSHSSVRAELPREYLRAQGAGRGADSVSERRRKPERGIQAARHRGAGSVFRSHEGTHQHVLRQRHRRARRLRASAVPRPVGDRRRFGAEGRRHGPSRRDLRQHGRAAVLDAGRVAALPRLGHGRHRDDEPAGSEARARGRDLLRDAGARDRLRLLASVPRRRDRRSDHRQPDAEREDGAAGDRRGSRRG